MSSKLAKYILPAALLLFGPFSAFAGEAENEVEQGIDTAEETRTFDDTHTPRYKIMMQNLEDAYDRGELTRTEYIQQLREIQDREEK